MRRSSRQIVAEIEALLGFLPSFFIPTLQNPALLENLWQQTLFAYINNPLPALLKEKLSAYLSYYYAIGYATICHSCTLYSLGMKASEVLDLITSPPPTQADINRCLTKMIKQTECLKTWQEPNPVLEECLLDCSIFIALEPAPEYCSQQLCQILGGDNYQYLVALIAYIKACHEWMKNYPEVAYEADKRAIDYLDRLLQDEPGLVECFYNYQKRVRREQHNCAFTELEIPLVEQVANQCAIAIRQAQLYQAARAQVESLQKLNVIKDDFLSTVSHELRAHLANMNMALTLLSRFTDIWEGKAKRYLEILITECDLEMTLVDNLLDLQRLEAISDLPLLSEAINLPDFLPKIVAPFQARSEQRQLLLQIHLPSELPELVTERTNVARILVELLNNACKYTLAGGEIILSVEYKRAISKMQFCISNSTEIPAAHLSHIFEKFYRIPDVEPWRQSGTGLGLALLQQLVQRLCGTISVESSNGWTTFTIMLPNLPL